MYLRYECVAASAMSQHTRLQLRRSCYLDHAWQTTNTRNGTTKSLIERSRHLHHISQSLSCKWENVDVENTLSCEKKWEVRLNSSSHQCFVNSTENLLFEILNVPSTDLVTSKPPVIIKKTPLPLACSPTWSNIFSCRLPWSWCAEEVLGVQEFQQLKTGFTFFLGLDVAFIFSCGISNL